MKKQLTTLAICGFTGLNSLADGMNSRTLASGETTVTVYRDNALSTELDKPNTNRNVFAIHQEGKIILINAGSGGEDGFLKRFIADGHKPEDVTAILINDMRNDHIGGLLIGRQYAIRHEGGVNTYLPGVTFTNATLYISKIEKELVDKIPLPRNMVSPPHLTRQVTNAYKDRIVTFDFDTEILPNIIAVETLKQTPEQVIGTTIFIVHDIMFIGSLDVETTTADQQDKSWQKNAVDKKLQIAGTRLPFPAIGKIISNNKDGYTFTVAE